MAQDDLTAPPDRHRNSAEEHSGSARARLLPARDYQALKAATRDLVSTAGGPNRASTITRGAPSYLSRYGLAHEQMFAPVDIIADLEAECGTPFVTRMLADLAGYDLVPKAEASASADRLTSHLGDVARTAGGVMSSLADAIGDGQLTEDERRAIDSRAAETETELAELRRDLSSTPVVSLPRRRG